MCRFVAYMGKPILMGEILVKPWNSIVLQSLQARESTTPTNGDGFGLGWYVPDISPEPALFTSIFPAWNDQNLRHLTSKIQSGCFFAHVRAAGIGGVNTYNCHPFIFKNSMLMHNGDMNAFSRIKRHLRHLLDDEIYNWIQGETDSEHFFALFLQNARKRKCMTLKDSLSVFRETLDQIEKLGEMYGCTDGPSFYNICLTDGKTMIASRYTTHGDEYISLHYSQGSHFVHTENQEHQLKSSTNPKCTLITSEQLTDVSQDWYLVPPNHILLVNEQHEIEIVPV